MALLYSRDPPVSVNATILVVEDNPDHVGLIEAVISRGLRGARVRVALLCEGARRYLRGEWAAYEDNEPNNPVPDLILLDVGMPDGTGFDLLRWISERERFSHIPVIMFTASTDPEHESLARQFGVRRYLIKPQHYGDLVWVIKEELEAASALATSRSRTSSVAR
jgi:DNA-binding response OmpR family regulator